jgi:hypothetical protein
MIKPLVPALPYAAATGRSPYVDGELAAIRATSAPRALSHEGTSQARREAASDGITIDGWAAEGDPWSDDESRSGRQQRARSGFAVSLPFLVQHLAQETVPTGLYRERWSEGVRAYQLAAAAASVDPAGLNLAA